MKKSKGRRTPVKDPTPVIAGRVPQSLHRQIKEAAKKSGRTMSDELAYRTRMSFAWEATLGEYEQARKRLMDMYERDRKTFAEATQADTERELERLGWAKILDLRRSGHVWLPPGRHDFPKSGWRDPNDNTPPPTGRIIPEPEFLKAVAEPKTREVVEAIIHELRSELVDLLNAKLGDPKNEGKSQ